MTDKKKVTLGSMSMADSLLAKALDKIYNAPFRKYDLIDKIVSLQEELTKHIKQFQSRHKKLVGILPKDDDGKPIIKNAQELGQRLLAQKWIGRRDHHVIAWPLLLHLTHEPVRAKAGFAALRTRQEQDKARYAIPGQSLAFVKVQPELVAPYFYKVTRHLRAVRSLQC